MLAHDPVTEVGTMVLTAFHRHLIVDANRLSVETPQVFRDPQLERILGSGLQVAVRYDFGDVDVLLHSR